MFLTLTENDVSTAFNSDRITYLFKRHDGGTTLFVDGQFRYVSEDFNLVANLLGSLPTS